MRNTMGFLKQTMEVGHGITARIALAPMPEADASGKYPLLGMIGGPKSPMILLQFVRGTSIIDMRKWNETICGSDSVTLADGTALDEEALHAIDREGWELLMQYGLIPNALV